MRNVAGFRPKARLEPQLDISNRCESYHIEDFGEDMIVLLRSLLFREPGSNNGTDFGSLMLSIEPGHP